MEDEEIMIIPDEEPGESVNQSARIYTGPNITELGLRHYTVYRGNLPGYMEAMCEEYPAINRLFMDITDFASGNDIIETGTPEWEEVTELLRSITRKEA